MAFLKEIVQAASRVLLQNLAYREPPTDASAAVTIVCDGEGSTRFLAHVPEPTIAAAADRLLRSRREWLDVPGTADQVHAGCVQVLAYLGVNAGALAIFANAGAIQVTFRETLPRSVVEFPWEFVLAEATKPIRRGILAPRSKLFVVFRHLDSLARPSDEPHLADPPTSLLVVDSAPGGLAGAYSFESERRLVESALEFSKNVPLSDPDRDQLKQTIEANHPNVIHLSGIDSQQGRTLLGPGAVDATQPQDGVFLSANGRPFIVSFSDLATVLTAGPAPHLIAFNLYNSAMGAHEVVRLGAAAAIGFQDEIDDSVAELFFATFYGEWKRAEWDLLGAFRDTWANLGPQADKVRGTGIVMWTRTALLAPHTAAVSATRSRSRRTAADAAAAASAAEKNPDEVKDASEHIDVEYVPPVQLNYSLLHNNANIVPRLIIRRQTAGTYRSIGVQVTVSAGPQEASYRTTLKLDDKQPKVDVHEKVRVPLTSELTRTLDESLFSTIYVAVRWGKHVLKEETHRVAFMPVDEWKYDGANARWLPSFVFPRDPIVREIVSAAQRYLVALRDDSGAGFDGYQSFEPAGASIAERCRNIDAQVQAIWWALVNDYALGYINPPPNFTDNAQRLRTPSEVVTGRRGTCIDLALLLAACLEYVEIYPVIFLLNDHAFPGYWRSEASYKELGSLSLATSEQTTENSPVVIADRDAHPDPWMLGRGRFADITKLVNDGHLVPIESVSITSRLGFWPAVDEGLGNLRSRRQFHSLFDLLTARKKVTPIPIWSKRV